LNIDREKGGGLNNVHMMILFGTVCAASSEKESRANFSHSNQL